MASAIVCEMSITTILGHKSRFHCGIGKVLVTTSWCVKKKEILVTNTNVITRYSPPKKKKKTYFMYACALANLARRFAAKHPVCADEVYGLGATLVHEMVGGVEKGPATIDDIVLLCVGNSHEHTGIITAAAREKHTDCGSNQLHLSKTTYTKATTHHQKSDPSFHIPNERDGTFLPISICHDAHSRWDGLGSRVVSVCFRHCDCITAIIFVLVLCACD